MANMSKAAMALDELDKQTSGAKEVFTLEEIRQRNNINILLPYVNDDDDPDNYNQYEFVTVNGKTTQIRKGEVVGVSWKIYEALKHSKEYANQKILA